MILHSGFRPRPYYLSTVGLNLTVEKLHSGPRPRGNYLSILGLNPDVHKSNSGPARNIDLLVSTMAHNAIYWTEGQN